MSYCASRFHTIRRATVEVMIGSVGVGGHHPLRIQSMTTSDTQDVTATVRQSIALAEVGCEIVRITAPNVQAARCLKAIRAELDAAGFGHIPLVADIHFLPSAAMEAVEHVEKIRVNPGNYADKKKFAVREYTDADYDRELQRLHESFSPLVKRCRELGRAMRIGTNHGSLSDRIMNRYGDTPLGMVESALEFLRICESHGYRQLILSMKASNPKVMIQAYRLLVHRMEQEAMYYPLHLGVTEAGDGEDGRIKSAIGIGSLLFDGLGDTIRVSLTEDSVYEIPVARALADKAMALWKTPDSPATNLRPSASTTDTDAVDPFHFVRREPAVVLLAENCVTGAEQPPRVILRVPTATALLETARQLASTRLVDTPVEGLLIPVDSLADLTLVRETAAHVPLPAQFLLLGVSPALQPVDLDPFLRSSLGSVGLLRTFADADGPLLASFAQLVARHGRFLVVAATPSALTALAPTLQTLDPAHLIVTLNDTARLSPETARHPLGAYRRLADALHLAGLRTPLWIRSTPALHSVFGPPASASNANAAKAPDFLSRLLDAAILGGALLCDGLGDLLSVETEADPTRATTLAYNVLQGAGARISKTEFVACPSCGRTLFDLQTTTQRIRAKTGHLKGVKLAIMGCIVNGPGEMADADFGYVGGAPGKINLYVGKNCVQYNLPQAEADDRLIALIKEHGKWAEAPANVSVS